MEKKQTQGQSTETTRGTKNAEINLPQIYVALYDWPCIQLED